MIEVEAVKPGNLVLSKNAASGELAYRAVLKTTAREPEEIWKVTTDEGEIRGTGGHNFWVSGKGWTLFRDLKPADRFHGVNGPVTIRAIGQEATAPTYHLVVADFHTYFVGPSLVLSHDVTFARPVDATVPGMKVD